MTSKVEAIRRYSKKGRSTNFLGPMRPLKWIGGRHHSPRRRTLTETLNEVEIFKAKITSKC